MSPQGGTMQQIEAVQRLHLWLETGEGMLLGLGRIQLLELVEELGSLNKAASAMGMSYRAAWGKIKATEKALGLKLLEVVTGGKGGGGATLTKDARELVEKYKKFYVRMDVLMQKEFERIFGMK